MKSGVQNKLSMQNVQQNQRSNQCSLFSDIQDVHKNLYLKDKNGNFCPK